MEVSHLRRLAIEVFKTLKSFNQDFMHTDFKKVHTLLGEEMA